MLVRLDIRIAWGLPAQNNPTGDVRGVHMGVLLLPGRLRERGWVLCGEAGFIKNEFDGLRQVGLAIGMILGMRGKR